MTTIAIVFWTVVLAAGVGALLLGLRDGATDRTTTSTDTRRSTPVNDRIAS